MGFQVLPRAWKVLWGHMMLFMSRTLIGVEGWGKVDERKGIGPPVGT